METCKKVEAAGHQIYGTLRANTEIPASLKQFVETMKEKGDIAFTKSPENNITI